MATRSRFRSSGQAEPPLGSHIVTPRRGYRHHGIYSGNGMVVHFSGMAHWPRWRDWASLPRLLRTSRVEEIPLRHFCAGHGFKILPHRHARYTGAEAVERARSRLNEQGYATMSNNCEHFVNWCLEGRAQSWLIWRMLLLLGSAAGLLRFLAGRTFHTPPTRHLVALVRSGTVSVLATMAMARLTSMGLRQARGLDRVEKQCRRHGLSGVLAGVILATLLSIWGADNGRRRWALLSPFLLPTLGGLLGYLWSRGLGCLQKKAKMTL